MTTNHTPGPWKVAPNGSIVTSDMTQTVAPCIDNEANARLISAAPDLLAALESMLYAVRHNIDGNPPTADKIFFWAGNESISAIAKARGE